MTDRLITLFWNPEEGRLRLIFRLGILILLHIGIFYAMRELRYLMGIFYTDDSSTDMLYLDLFRNFWYALTIALTVVIISIMIDRRKIRSLFVSPSKRWLIGFSAGVVLVTVLLSGKFLIMLDKGWIEIYSYFSTTGPNTSFVKEIFIVILTFAFVASSEELLFRGLVLRNLLEGLSWLPNRVNAGVSILTAAVVFSLVHMNAYGVSSISMITICLHGIMYGLATVISGSLLFAVGFHFAHNILIGGVYGIAANYWLHGSPKVFLLQYPRMDYLFTTPPVSSAQALTILVNVMAIVAVIILGRISTGRWFDVSVIKSWKKEKST